MAITREEKNRRARLRYRRKRWDAVDFPAPKDGKLHQALLPSVAEKNPLTVTKYVPPERKPRTPSKKKSAPKDDQPMMDFAK